MASEALKVNESLTTINLGDNEIGPDGAKALAEVRGRCPCECSLERVNVSLYAFIAMLFAYRMDRSSVLSVVCNHLCQVCFCQQHLALFLKRRVTPSALLTLAPGVSCKAFE